MRANTLNMHTHTTHASHMLVKAPVCLLPLSKRAYLCHLFIYFVLCADVCFLYGEMAGFFEGIWNKLKSVYRMCRGDQPAPDPEAGKSGSASPPPKEPQDTAADAQPQGASAQFAGEEDIVKTEEYEPAMVRYYVEVGEEEVVNARRGLFDRRDQEKGGGGGINTKCTAHLVERKHVMHTKLMCVQLIQENMLCSKVLCIRHSVSTE